MTWADRALLTVEQLRLYLTRFRGLARFKPWPEYFRNGDGDPSDPRYLARLDEINEDFVGWLNPGTTEAPDRSSVQSEGHLATFPSASPSGVPEVDRVALKIYPTPPDAPDVGVLFHHWIYADGWAAIDFLLKPLTQKYRVAAMAAPHHLTRRAPDFGAGEGFLNPNVLDIYSASRQWQSDHAACLALLRRDYGFADTVLLGYSLGGYGCLLSRLFAPPRPTVAICVTNHLTRGVTEGLASRDLRERLWEAGFSYESYWWATRSFHLARWAQRIGGEDLTWMYARHDRIEPRESLEEAIQALSPERLVELPGGHSTAGFFRDRIAAEVAARVEERLCERSGGAAALRTAIA